MGIGRRRLHPDDEISADDNQQVRRQVALRHANLFLGACNWQRGVPEEWKRAQDQALRATALASQAELDVIVRNRPVPRRASHHYDGVNSLSLTGGGHTFYFY